MHKIATPRADNLKGGYESLRERLMAADAAAAESLKFIFPESAPQNTEAAIVMLTGYMGFDPQPWTYRELLEMAVVKRSTVIEAEIVADRMEADTDIRLRLAELAKQSQDAPAFTLKVKPKKSTQKGDARVKLIAALTAHHKYADGGSLNSEPMSVRALARAAAVSVSSASRFFDEHFSGKGNNGGGHRTYAAACRRDFKVRVLPVLKSLNGDYQIDDTYHDNPPGERDTR